MKNILKLFFALSLVCIFTAVSAEANIGYTIEDGKLILDEMTGDKVSILFVKDGVSQDAITADNSFVILAGASGEKLEFPLLCTDVGEGFLSADYILTVTNDGKTVIKETLGYIPQQKLDAFIMAMSQKDENGIKADIQKHLAALGMPAGANACDDQYITEIASIIRQNSTETMTFAKFKEISTFYNDRKKFLNELKETVLWSQIPVLVDKYAHIFADSSINTYGNKVSAAYTKFVGADYTRIEDFEKEYIESVKSASDAGNASSGGNKNSGSSGGGGGGFSPRPAENGGGTAEVQKDQDHETKKPSANGTFADMADAEWAAEAVETLVKAGAISGVDGKSFEPNSYITREAFVKILCVAFAIEGTEDASGFNDVDEKAWYAPYVASAKGAGLVMGNGEQFGVGENITRQDAAVLLGRIAGLQEISLKSGDADFFDRNEIAGYAAEAVGDLRASGIISGMEDGGFYPARNMTRAEGAKLIYELMKLKEVK